MELDPITALRARTAAKEREMTEYDRREASLRRLLCMAKVSKKAPKP